MKKLILASVSGIALMGLAACSDTDETTTQTVPDQAPIVEPSEQEMAPADDAAPMEETDPMAPAPAPAD